MSRIAKFTFNPFAENTYVVYDETGDCVVFDPGCYTPEEKEQLADFIQQQNLKPVHLINTHCHIDHILGNKFVTDTWKVPFVTNKEEVAVLHATYNYGAMFGLEVEHSPDPDSFLNDGDTFSFGNTTYQILFTPGHSPGSISFYNEAEGYIIAGDVLFQRGIGRTDLPGGDKDTLIQSIRTKLYALPDDTVVYCGHGPETTIGEEKMSNPFVRA